MTATDTQWPRYQVFHQERDDLPHVNAGTVHAPDAEMALQNARDVFVRRPDCVSLWAARAEDIASLTAEELERDGLPEQAQGPMKTYEVFLKKLQIGSHEHAGTLEAASTGGAFRAAIKDYGIEGVLVWWVVPSSSISRTEADDIDSLFEPAATKLYRDQAFYHTATLMRRLREEKGKRR